MKKRFAVEQIKRFLREADAGMAVKDLQYADSSGRRAYVEHDTNASACGVPKKARVEANDPSGRVILIGQDQ